MSYPIAETPPAVWDRAQEFIIDGAVVTDPLFTAAGAGQVDLVYKGRRFLIGINDEACKTYVVTLERAGLPHLANDLSHGDEEVFVGEVPRDARALTQIGYSRQSERGTTTLDAFYSLGRSIGTLISRTGVVPRAEDFSLHKVLARRLEEGTLLLPPLNLDPADEQSQMALIQRVNSELVVAYERFGATALFTSFEIGLTHEY